MYKCICWLIIEVILRNARCNNESKKHNIVLYFALLTFLLVTISSLVMVQLQTETCSY